MPHQARTDTEIKKCFEVMSKLRTHLKKDEFLQLVQQMETEGFRLAYLEDKGTIVAVAGYRIFTNLFSGKNLYVDDLVTSEKRTIKRSRRNHDCMAKRRSKSTWL